MTRDRKRGMKFPIVQVPPLNMADHIRTVGHLFFPVPELILCCVAALKVVESI